MKTLLPKLKYLFWLGPMLVLAGVSAGVVSGAWNSLPLGLLIAGLVVIGLWVMVQSQSNSGFWGRRSTQASTNAIVATLSVLAILGLINFLGVRYATRMDLTENQVFTLAPETQQLVRTLRQPVKVWVFDPQQIPQDRELLESYRRQGSQFNFEFVDPNAQPTLAESFKVINDSEGGFKLGDVFIEHGTRRLFVQNVNPQERLSEIKLTSAIERAISDRQSQLYFLQGHGERPIEEGRAALLQAVKTLQDRNYAIKPLNLIETKDFPADANAIVVAGPQKALLDPEVKALEAYLNQGGNVLLMLDPGNNAGLDRVLSSWGVTLDNRVVIDASGRLAELGPAYASVTQYGDHPISRELGSSLSFFPVARPVDTNAVPTIKSTPILFTSDRSWAESNLKATPLTFDPKSDRPGPLVLGVALTRPAQPAPQPSPSPTTSPTPQASPTGSPSPTASPTPQASPTPSPTASPTPQASPTGSPSPTISPSPQASPSPASAKESRLVVLGNSSFATDGFFDRVVNGDIFLNSVRWLGQQDARSFAIRPKEAKNRRIILSDQQAGLAGWTALGILPLAAFGTAFAVWWRRR